MKITKEEKERADRQVTEVRVKNWHECIVCKASYKKTWMWADWGEIIAVGTEIWKDYNWLCEECAPTKEKAYQIFIDRERNPVKYYDVAMKRLIDLVGGQ